MYTDFCLRFSSSILLRDWGQEEAKVLVPGQATQGRQSWTQNGGLLDSQLTFLFLFSHCFLETAL